MTTEKAPSGGNSVNGAADRSASARDDEVSHLYQLLYARDQLGFCGCGCPEEAYALVRDILNLAPFYDNPEAIETLTGKAAYYFVLYQLDRCDLIEHGGGIGGSWLTDRGKLYLPLLNAHSHDEIDECGFPHDGDDCPADCRFVRTRS